MQPAGSNGQAKNMTSGGKKSKLCLFYRLNCFPVLKQFIEYFLFSDVKINGANAVNKSIYVLYVYIQRQTKIVNALFTKMLGNYFLFMSNCFEIVFIRKNY